MSAPGVVLMGEGLRGEDGAAELHQEDGLQREERMGTGSLPRRDFRKTHLFAEMERMQPGVSSWEGAIPLHRQIHEQTTPGQSTVLHRVLVESYTDSKDATATVLRVSGTCLRDAFGGTRTFF